MVKRVNKHSDGMYHVNGKTYKVLKGSRAAVWHETAFKTSGGLEKKDLVKNNRGRIVSKSKHNKMKTEKGSRFRKAGYELAKRGKWGPRRFLRDRTVTARKNKSKTVKKRRTV
tara:strand:+ start:367 stop:705 length:339 start_codon:yes stop_codon:yes gene_type:complete